MLARLFGGLLHRKKTVEIKEGDEASVRKQIEEMIGDHRLEVANYLKDRKDGSILGYAQTLANTYTDESLSEFHMYAPDLAAWEYADRHNLDTKEHFDQLALVSECFKDAVFLSEHLADMYEFEDEEDLQSISWEDLWLDCSMALDDEAEKEKYQSHNIEFSDEARTLACFVALVLIAKDLNP